MKRLLFHAPPAGTRLSVALLVLRLMVGIAFMIHGLPKMKDPTGWMGPHGFAPPFLQGLAAFAEFAGGVALVIGVFTSLAALLICIDMFVALFVVELPRGTSFTGMGHTYEPALFYLASTLALGFAGPGRFSVDARVAGEPQPLARRRL